MLSSQTLFIGFQCRRCCFDCKPFSQLQPILPIQAASCRPLHACTTHTFLPALHTKLVWSVCLSHCSAISAVQGYAYILTHPGMPCIFIDHVTAADEAENSSSLVGTIKSLLGLRKQLSISATCKVLYFCTLGSSQRGLILSAISTNSEK